MDSELKLRVIQEALKLGVSATCRKHKISRTLFYRWLKRYQQNGLKGLEPLRKTFRPHNKTEQDIVDKLLVLVKKHPRIGPRELKYYLEGHGHYISESAVYNILLRHGLTRRNDRIRYARGIYPQIGLQPPDFDQSKIGSCWLLWATSYGSFAGTGTIYEFTIFDYKSRVACSRVHNTFSPAHFTSLLTAVAIPIAQCLEFDAKHFFFMDTLGLQDKDYPALISQVQDALHQSGLSVAMHRQQKQTPMPQLEALREAYTATVSAALLPHLLAGRSLLEVRLVLQQFLRSYNYNHSLVYEHLICPPLEYLTTATGILPVLPIWAYMDRQY